jgi:flagella basal body P-ring formation protein FlgA
VLKDKDKSKLRGYTLQDPSIIIGAKTNRYISAGQAITTQHVCSVCEGDSVTIVAQADGLQVKAVGIAKENGSLGDTISVLNKSSNRIIQAKVSAVGTVTIEL